MTGRTLISDALAELGVLQPGQVADADQAAAGLTVLQRIIDSLGAEAQAIVRVIRTVKTLTANTRDYTIGTGGSINIAAPLYLESAAIILDSTATTPIEYGIEILETAEWERLPMKTFAAPMVQAIYYDPAASSASLGTVSTYPTINIANTQLVLYTALALTGFADLTTDYVFPPGYREAFHYELCYQLQRPFGRSMDPEIKEQRGDAWARAKRPNLSLSEVILDPMISGAGRFYNILTDGS